ncbi:DUF975 family protein [Nicoliella spurrieriana]|uniref:DUF975 family protein n=1 Tax=Nicoliella spurrieriana TaxID=2925830 RepID=A0A976RTI4_9LACO|nr:DUF975 family protein [Nicoliella spurrieriana]UQS87369.1 DUF975 family protein [Nicoliella spurrieriana]
MKFADLKNEAKEQLNPHYGFFLLLLLPTYILNVISFGLTYPNYFNVSRMVSNDPSAYYESLNDNVSYGPGLLGLLTGALLLSAMFIMIKAMRGQENDFKGGFQKAFNIFTRGDYFFGAFMVGLLKLVYTILWTLAVVLATGIVVGIVLLINHESAGAAVAVFLGTVIFIAGAIFVYIKTNLAYSQSQFIFRDAIDSDSPISYNEAITQSRQLMDGHKGQFFLLWWSFFFWYVLSAVTLGLAGIFYVTPYTKLTYANYYVKLVDGQK